MIFYVAFCLLISTCSLFARNISFDINNQTENQIYLKSFIDHYSVFEEEYAFSEEEVLVERKKSKHLEGTVLSELYFDQMKKINKEASAEGDKNVYKDQFLLEIDGEKFILYWDLGDFGSWEPKSLSLGEHDAYEMIVLPKHNTPFSFDIIIRKKSSNK